MALAIHLSAVWCYYYLNLSSGQTSRNATNHLRHNTDMCFSKVPYGSAYMSSTYLPPSQLQYFFLQGKDLVFVIHTQR